MSVINISNTMVNNQQIQSDKLNIINWITQLNDDTLLEKVKSIMSTSDLCLLDIEQKNAIDEAFSSIKTEGTKSHSTIIEETKLRYPHLFERQY